MSRNYREPASNLRKGDVIKASNLNKLVTTQAFSPYNTQREQYQGQVERKPFDCVSCILSGDEWQFKLKTSYAPIDSFPVEILGRVGTAAKPLSEAVFNVPFNDGATPEIERFYYDRTENQLKDQRFITAGLETEPSLISLNQRYQYILQVETKNSGITFTNFHPYSIEKLYTFPFEVIAVPVDDSNVLVAVSPGYVCNADNKDASDETIKYHMPVIDMDGTMVALDYFIEDNYNLSTRPHFELAAGEDPQYIYLKIQTDPRDLITGDVEVIMSDDSELDYTSTHAHPNPVAQNGEYYLKIAEVFVTAATLSGAYMNGPYANSRITQYQYGSPILWRQVDPELENIGGKREIYKTQRTSDAVYEFRTIEQLEGRGEPVIKPLSAATESSPAEEEGDTIKWVRIAEKVSQPQIRVSTKDDGSVIQIEGNGENPVYTDPFGGMIEFEDGLVTSVTPSDVEGSNFNIKLLNVSITETAGETYVSDIGWGTAGERFFYVRGGLLTLVDDLANVDTYEVISRIEGETYSIDGTNESGTGFTEADP